MPNVLSQLCMTVVAFMLLSLELVLQLSSGVRSLDASFSRFTVMAGCTVCRSPSFRISILPHLVAHFVLMSLIVFSAMRNCFFFMCLITSTTTSILSFPISSMVLPIVLIQVLSMRLSISIILCLHLFFTLLIVSFFLGIFAYFTRCAKPIFFASISGEKLRGCWIRVWAFGASFLRGIIHGLNHLCLVTLFLVLPGW